MTMDAKSKEILLDVKNVSLTFGAVQAIVDVSFDIQPGQTLALVGESGSGKGILAQTIHNLSARKNKPFVTVDCSAIAPSLIDNELFGHVRGAYTGAGSQAGGETRLVVFEQSHYVGILVVPAGQSTCMDRVFGMDGFSPDSPTHFVRVLVPSRLESSLTNDFWGSINDN